MLQNTLILFVLALLTAVIGFSEIGGVGSGIAQILFAVFLILAILSFIKQGSKTT